MIIFTFIFTFLIVVVINTYKDERLAQMEVMNKNNLVTEKDIRIDELLSEIEQLNKDYKLLNQDFENLEDENKSLIEKVSYQQHLSLSFIERYHGMKYPVTSGLRQYIGEEPLRVYPNSKAPYVYEDYKPRRC